MTIFSQVIENMKSRVRRESHARFCGKVRVKFPCLTRLAVIYMKDTIPHTARALVMELSVKQEHAVNLILAKLLGIKAEESRSFGTSNQALSFNAKANLLLDLRQLDKLQREKFQIFMEVRNKFAHLNSIDTFEKCFSILGNYKRLKTIFGVDVEGDSLEEDMQTMFCVLSMDLTMTLQKIRDEISKDFAKKYTSRRWFEIFKEKKVEYKEKHPTHAGSVDHFVTYIKRFMLEEVDEKIMNNVPPHT
jgi:hypothetical protein